MDNITILKEGVKTALNLKGLLKIVCIILLIIFLIIEIFSIHIVKEFSHPKIRELKNKFSSYGIKNYEKVTFHSEKRDIKLNGYLIKNDNSKKTIIICHGYGDNKFMVGGKKTPEKVDHLKLAKIFSNEGYNTLIFDFRGHGENGHNAGVTIGFNEQKDLLGAIDFIKGRGIGEKIGVLGSSMGGATSLSVLDKTKDISFAIADSPFSDLKDYLSNNIKVWTGLPKFPFAPMAIANFKLIYGVNYSEVSPLNSVSKVDIPILIIHGKKDITIPYTESVKIKDRFKNKKSKLVLFDNSVHVGSYYMYSDKYEENIKSFLKSI
ncbi:alpha/beta hydrolase [Clostridium lundense]|uniref:alpha/beta hydrolase n=1 Tax=Clostridium lundense TaxID=319475 RepID=UPI000488CE87|nr:alpha/beta hydrolase [Clostridium lundense]